jgi:hypothetical protein
MIGINISRRTSRQIAENEERARSALLTSKSRKGQLLFATKLVVPELGRYTPVV